MNRSREFYTRCARWAGLLVVCFVAFSFAFVPLRGSQDEWWHLKTGQWIVQHGHLPVNDIFTYTGANLRWYNHEWLSQVIFYLVYSMAAHSTSAGLVALIAFKSTIVMLTFGIGCTFLARQRGVAWPLALLIALLGADIARRTIFVRPPIFSYAFMVVFLGILSAWKQKRLSPRWLFVLPALTILWANLHGMVILAPVLVGAYFGGELIGALFRVRRERNGTSRFPYQTFAPSALLLAVCVLVMLCCLAQPSGYHLFFLGHNFTADPLLKTTIAEMLPTPGILTRVDPAQPWSLHNFAVSPPGFWTFWIVLGIFIVLAIWNRFRLPWTADYFLLLFFGWQAVAHWRLLPLFAIVAACSGAGLLAFFLARRSMRTQYVVSRVAAVLVPMTAVIFVGVIGEPPPETFLKRNLELAHGLAMNLVDYPTPLMDFIIKAKLPDRMFSDSNYCGYTIWRLSPEYHKLFTDNRFDLFGSEFYKLERVVVNAGTRGDEFRDGQVVKESWWEILARYDVNFLVFRPGDHPAFHRALRNSGKWIHLHDYFAPGESPLPRGINPSRQGWSIWLRDEPRFADVITRATALNNEMNPGLPSPETLDAAWMGPRQISPDQTSGTQNSLPDWRVN